MLQRIQSIWLLIASVFTFLTLNFSTYSGTNKKLIPSSFLTGKETIPMVIITVAIGLLALIAIFLYNNRKLQVRLTGLAILLECVLIYLYYREIQLFVGKGAISITALFHVIILLFLILAARAISSDERLVKDSNRLR
ncbi:MAG: DUF4293 domain-containing protein [Ferruginibacter sp.]